MIYLVATGFRFYSVFIGKNFFFSRNLRGFVILIFYEIKYGRWKAWGLS